jgi:1-acyl-sn-glycerol-3-phosphate acyltransferase
MPQVMSRESTVPTLGPERVRTSYMLTFRGLLFLLKLSLLTMIDGLLKRVDNAVIERRMKALGDEIVRLGQCDISIEGLEHLEPGKTYLFMSNHESVLDIPFLFHACPVPPRMVTKAELFKVPVFGPALKAAGFISIDRKNRTRAIKSLQEAGEVIKQGRPLLIFPEGTRSRDGSLLPFKKGGFMLALELGATIIPIGIQGAFEMIRPNSLKVALGQHPAVRFGAPIGATAYGPDQREQLMADVREAIARLRRPGA